jgi:hypothetical protein
VIIFKNEREKIEHVTDSELLRSMNVEVATCLSSFFFNQSQQVLLLPTLGKWSRMELDLDLDLISQMHIFIEIHLYIHEICFANKIYDSYRSS